MIRIYVRAVIVLLGLLCAAPASAARDLPGLADLVERLSPAVVNVSATPQPKARRGNEADSRDPMNEFYRRFMPKHPQLPREEDEQSLGSGFIVSSDG